MELKEDTIYKIDFKCPSCGGNKLVQTNRTIVQSGIDAMWFYTDEDNNHPDRCVYDYEINDDEKIIWDNAEFEYHECAYCRFELPEDNEELFNWLKDRNMLRKQ